MQWIEIPPESVEPELFNLSEVNGCMAAQYSGPGSLDMCQDDGWRVFADVLNTCPVDGTPLPKATVYLFRVLGR